MSNIIAFDTFLYKSLTQRQALEIVRHIANLEGGTNVELTFHARERMKERNITMRQILTCLRKGNIYDPPYKDNKGNWTCRVTRVCAGDDLNVVVRFDPQTKIAVITTF